MPNDNNKIGLMLFFFSRYKTCVVLLRVRIMRPRGAININGVAKREDDKRPLAHARTGNIETGI